MKQKQEPKPKQPPPSFEPRGDGMDDIREALGYRRTNEEGRVRLFVDEEEEEAGA